MGWADISPPPKLKCASLNPLYLENVTIFREMPFKEVNKVKCGHMCGNLCNTTSDLIRRGDEDREERPGKDTVRKEAARELRKEVSEQTKPGSWT